VTPSRLLSLSVRGQKDLSQSWFSLLLQILRTFLTFHLATKTIPVTSTTRQFQITVTARRFLQQLWQPFMHSLTKIQTHGFMLLVAPNREPDCTEWALLSIIPWSKRTSKFMVKLATIGILSRKTRNMTVFLLREKFRNFAL
jgi:hypothetical protein